MAKNITGLQQVCLYNPTNGDRVNLKHISANSEYNPEPVTSETGTGVISGGQSTTFTISFFDNPAGMRTQLETWENDATELQLVALFASGVLFWNQPEPITGFIDSLAVNARDGVSPFSFSIEYIGFDPDIYYGMNFLRAALKRNADGRTQYDQTENYIPLRRTTSGSDMWQLKEAVTSSFAQTINDSGVFRIPFPFPNVAINVSSDTDSGPSHTTVSAQQFNGTVINSSTIDNNGNNNVFTPGAGAFWLGWAYPSDQVHSLTARIGGTEYLNA